MSLNTIIETSQIIIPASDKEIYIHTKNKYADIAFFWWTKEWNEFPWQTAMREIYEETDLILWQEQLEFIEKSTNTLDHGTFKSTLYRTPIIKSLTWEWIQRVSLEDLQIVDVTFMVSKEDFLRRTNLALKNINRIYGT